MPASALIGYMAAYRIEPWGETRADIREAYIAAMQHNLNRTRGMKAMKTEDFIAQFKPKKRQTAAEMEMMFSMFAAGHNAKLESAHG